MTPLDTCNHSTSSMLDAKALGGLSKEDFVEKLGGIYENSPWVAEKTYQSAPFESLTQLHNVMKSVVKRASGQDKMNLLNAHPDLAGKAAVAGDMTDDSKDEQSKAGLTRLSQEEFESLQDLNKEYRDRFGFPFILAVRNATKTTIFSAIKARVKNEQTQERNECLKQVDKIAWMRLCSQFSPSLTGFLTCHVLDTAQGCPAAGMRITLSHLESNGVRKLLGDFVTNSDGRLDSPALSGKSFTVGKYELVFHIADYFIAACVPTGGQPFLDEVPVRFGIDNPEDHYHVPLLCSPWSYSTYRGS